MLIIFDLDGTLYQFKENSFKKSRIYRKILANTECYIMDKLDKNRKEASLILKEIRKEYGDSISMGLEKKFQINRNDYFNKAWDIPAKPYIKKNNGLKNMLSIIKANFDFVLVSDAPKIWISHVLRELNIEDLFKGKIFSGEGNIRKEFNNALDKIQEYAGIEAKNCIVIGDQEETDIIPAKKIGMKTIFVSKGKKSCVADYTIKNILQIPKILDYFKYS